MDLCAYSQTVGPAGHAALGSYTRPSRRWRRGVER